MSTLTSASTLEAVQAAYDDNASYAEDNSPAKARLFITACRILIRREPRWIKHGNRHEIQLNVLRDELREAQAWLSAAAAGTSQNPHLALDISEALYCCLAACLVAGGALA